MKRMDLEKDLNIVGNNVKHVREKAKISQQLLSARLETIPVYICRASISKIEIGKRAVTDIEIYALAKALKLSPNELFDWERLKHQED